MHSRSVPFQMVGLYNDPKGKDIFTTKNTSTLATTVLKGGSQDEETVVSQLRKRIKELEDEVKEKDVCAELAKCWLISESNYKGHSYILPT